MTPTVHHAAAPSQRRRTVRLASMTAADWRTLSLVLPLAAATLYVGAGPLGAQESRPATPTATEGEIQALIDELGDPSFAARSRASRRLCMIGQRAAGLLERAAGIDEPEVALRAKSLLEVIDTVYFGGCDIHLAADKKRTVWDESITLTVRIRNESGYRAHLPLELPAEGGQHPGAEALLVGTMVDLSEYLRVLSPQGLPVSLRVDDIRADPQVVAAVAWRAEGGPLAALAPGQEVVVRLADFNRGWARFPLLERGTYRIQLIYEPQWDDDEFRRAGVGRVTSNTLDIEVAAAAPEVVRLAQRPAALTLEHLDETVAAFLTNTDDLPVHVNLNLISIEPPFAELAWTVMVGDWGEEVGIGSDVPQRFTGFSRERLVELKPGARTELGRVPVARLTDAAPAKTLQPGRRFSVQATWTNLTDAAWQHQQQSPVLDDPAAPAELRTPLPRRMLTGRFTSEVVELSK